MTPYVTYLRYRINEGVQPIKGKIEAIQNAPAPRNVQELKAYLRLLNYYWMFTYLVGSLYKLLKSNQSWKWSTEEATAFQASEDPLLSSQLLVYFDPNKEIILQCEASQYGIRAVLAHRMSEKPIGDVSRILSPAKRNYSQLKKEHVFGVELFHSYLFGHKFQLVTPLLTLFTK